MSRIAFISDIHGNMPALNAVLDDICTQDISDIYCLGDLVGYYSEINQVIDTIRERKIKCCMGNHDYAIAFNGGVIPRSRTCTNVLGTQLKYITKENLSFLSELPLMIEIESGDRSILCVHGGINDPVDEYIDVNDSSYFKNIESKYDILISGHNHIPIIKDYGTIFYGNTGSVGQPRDHDPRASYIIYESGELRIRRVEYNIDETRKKMREHGFPEYISEILYKGFRIGE